MGGTYHVQIGTAASRLACTYALDAQHQGEGMDHMPCHYYVISEVVAFVDSLDPARMPVVVLLMLA